MRVGLSSKESLLLFVRAARSAWTTRSVLSECVVSQVGKNGPRKADRLHHRVKVGVIALRKEPKMYVGSLAGISRSQLDGAVDISRLELHEATLKLVLRPTRHTRGETNEVEAPAVEVYIPCALGD